MGRVRTKKPIATPEFMQEVVAQITSAPNDEDLAKVLAQFEAPYRFEKSEERSLYNWIDVLNRIDEALERAVKKEPIVQLVSSPPESLPPEVDDSEVGQAASTPENREIIFQCLQVMLRLVGNSSDDTKNVYNSVEHLTALLAIDEERIVLLCIEIIRALLHRNSRLRPTKAHGSPILGNRLLSLSRGWGGREGGLGLVECCSPAAVETLPRDGASIRLEFLLEEPYGGSGSEANEAMGMSYGKRSIHIKDVSTVADDEQTFIMRIANEFNLPRRLRFTMLARYRRAKAFANGLESRLRYANIRLLALTTLAQMQLSPEPLPIVFHNEPELVSELVALARADPADGLESLPRTIRISALECLTAISIHGQRLKQVLSAAGVSSHHGTLPSMLRSEIAIFISQCRAQQEEEGAAVPMDSMSATGVAAEPSEPSHAAFVEALLGLVFALATAFPMSQGPTLLVVSGTVGTIAPLLEIKNRKNSKVVLQAIWALRCTIENTHASTGAAAFRENSGLSLVAQRIVDEVYQDDTEDTEEADEKVEVAALEARGESRALYVRLALASQPDPAIALQTAAPSSSAASRGVLPHTKRVMLRALLRLFALAHRHSSGNIRELTSGPLFQALRRLLARPFYYGGSLFAAAATAVADIAHAEPTAASTIAASGLSKAILKSIRVGLPPSGEAIRCVPGVLAAICLSAQGMEEVERASVLRTYLLRLATPFYGRAMHGETPVGIGTSLEELKRHVPSLQDDITGALVAYLKSAAEFVRTRTSAKDLEFKSPEGEVKSAAEVSTMLDRMKLTTAHNAARLGGLAGDITDGDVSVTKVALESLLDLCAAPAYANIESGYVPSSSSSLTAPTASNCLNSIISAIRHFLSKEPTRNSSTVFRLLFEHFVQDAAAFLRVGAQMGNCWFQEEDGLDDRDRTGMDTDKVADRASDIRGKVSKVLDAFDPKVPSPPPGSEHVNMKVDEDIVVDMDHAMPPGAEADMTPLSKEETRELLQPKLNELARKVRVDIVILSGLWRAHYFPVASWGGHSGVQLGAIIATVERATRWHLARAFTGVTVEMTKEADYFCTAKVSSVVLEGDVTPPDNGKDREEGAGAGERENGDEPAESTVKDGRRHLTGLAWSLATLVASTERMYSILSRGLTAKAKKTNTRHANSVKAVASMLGRILTMHLICANGLWSSDEAALSTNRKAPAAWDYLRGVLREIRSVLFANPWGVPPSLTQALVLEAFISWGGGSYLKEILHPTVLVSAARLLKDRDTRGAASRSARPGEVVAKLAANGEEASSADQHKAAAGRSNAEYDINDINEAFKPCSPFGATKPPDSPETVLVDSAIDVLFSFGQLAHNLCGCPGLFNSALSLAKFSTWKPQELRLTAQALAIDALKSIIDEGERIFEPRSLREQLIPSIITLVHTVSSTRDELLKRVVDEDAAAAAAKEHEDKDRNSSERGIGTLLPDNAALTQLLMMGFSREQSTAALRRAGQAGILGATDWLLTQQEGTAGGSDSEPRAPGTAKRGAAEPSSAPAAAAAAAAAASSSKSKAMDLQPEPRVSKTDTLGVCCGLELDLVRKALTGKTGAADASSSDYDPQGSTPNVVKMAKAVLARDITIVHDVPHSELESKKMQPISRGEWAQKVEALFASLRPLAVKFLEFNWQRVSSKESTFLAVELGTALDKGSEQNNECREMFANAIMGQLSRSIDRLQSASTSPSAKLAREEGLKLMNVAQIAAVWAHFGGAGARHALWERPFARKSLDFLTSSFSQRWEKRSQELSPSATDEEAAKPIEGLTLDPEQHQTALISAQEVSVQMASSCLLILDAFIRYAKADSFEKFARSNAALLAAGEAAAGNSAGGGGGGGGGGGDGGDGGDGGGRSSSGGNGGNGGGSGGSGGSGAQGAAAALGAAGGGGSGDDDKGASSERDKAMTDDAMDLQEAEKRLSKAVADAKVASDEAVATALTGLTPLLARYQLTTGQGNGLDGEVLLGLSLRMLDSSFVENSDAFLAVLQLVSSLTEDPDLATTFLQRGGLKLLLGSPQLGKSYWKTMNGLLRTVIRHLVEDKETLREAMEQEIFSLPEFSGGQPSRHLTGLNVAGLTTAMIPLFHRDPETFVWAVANTCRLQYSLVAVPRPEDQELDASKLRSNVTTVVNTLTDLLTAKDESGPRDDNEMLGLEMTFFALVRITELIELSPSCAKAFLVAKIHSQGKKPALDYVLSSLMPLPPITLSATNSAHVSWKEDISDGARALFAALSANVACVQAAGVAALSSVCAAEADQDVARAGMVKAVAMCFSPSLSDSVVKRLLQSGIAESLARCLDKLDLSRPGGTDTANAVLKALGMLGQAARHKPRAARADAQVSRSSLPQSLLRQRNVMQDMGFAGFARSGPEPLFEREYEAGGTYPNPGEWS